MKNRKSGHSFEIKTISFLLIAVFILHDIVLACPYSLQIELRTKRSDFRHAFDDRYDMTTRRKTDSSDPAASVSKLTGKNTSPDRRCYDEYCALESDAVMALGLLLGRSREDVTGYLIDTGIDYIGRRNIVDLNLPVTIMVGGEILSYQDMKNMGITNRPWRIVYTDGRDYKGYVMIYGEDDLKDFVIGKGGVVYKKAVTADEYENSQINAFAECGRRAENMNDKVIYWASFFFGAQGFLSAAPESDKEEVYKTWAASCYLAGVVGKIYIPGHDMGSHEAEMDWIEDGVYEAAIGTVIERKAYSGYRKRKLEGILRERRWQKLTPEDREDLGIYLPSTGRSESRGSFPQSGWMFMAQCVVGCFLNIYRDRDVTDFLGIPTEDLPVKQSPGDGTIIPGARRDIGGRTYQAVMKGNVMVWRPVIRITLGGFGTVTVSIMKILLTKYIDYPFEIVGIYETGGSIYSSDGLDRDELFRIAGFTRGGERRQIDSITFYSRPMRERTRFVGENSKNVLFEPTDVLILACEENVIGSGTDAARVKASIVMDAGNCSVNPSAREVFDSRQVSKSVSDRILYYPASAISGGLAYGSKEELYHSYTPAFRLIKRHHKSHVVDAIIELAASNTHRLNSLLHKNGFNVSPSALVSEIVSSARTVRRGILKDIRNCLEPDSSGTGIMLSSGLLHATSGIWKKEFELLSNRVFDRIKDGAPLRIAILESVSDMYAWSADPGENISVGGLRSDLLMKGPGNNQRRRVAANMLGEICTVIPMDKESLFGVIKELIEVIKPKNPLRAERYAPVRANAIHSIGKILGGRYNELIMCNPELCDDVENVFLDCLVDEDERVRSWAEWSIRHLGLDMSVRGMIIKRKIFNLNILRLQRSLRQPLSAVPNYWRGQLQTIKGSCEDVTGPFLWPSFIRSSRYLMKTVMAMARYILHTKHFSLLDQDLFGELGMNYQLLASLYEMKDDARGALRLYRMAQDSYMKGERQGGLMPAALQRKIARALESEGETEKALKQNMSLVDPVDMMRIMRGITYSEEFKMLHEAVELQAGEFRREAISDIFKLHPDIDDQDMADVMAGSFHKTLQSVMGFLREKDPLGENRLTNIWSKTSSTERWRLINAAEDDILNRFYHSGKNGILQAGSYYPNTALLLLFSTGIYKDTEFHYMLRRYIETGKIPGRFSTRRLGLRWHIYYKFNRAHLAKLISMKVCGSVKHDKATGVIYFSSTPAELEKAYDVAKIMAVYARKILGDYVPADRMQAALCAALANAFSHANGFDPYKKVIFKYEMSPDSAEFGISDEGAEDFNIPCMISSTFWQRISRHLFIGFLIRIPFLSDFLSQVRDKAKEIEYSVFANRLRRAFSNVLYMPYASDIQAQAGGKLQLIYDKSGVRPYFAVCRDTDTILRFRRTRRMEKQIEGSDLSGIHSIFCAVDPSWIKPAMLDFAGLSGLRFVVPKAGFLRQILKTELESLGARESECGAWKPGAPRNLVMELRSTPGFEDRPGIVLSVHLERAFARESALVFDPDSCAIVRDKNCDALCYDSAGVWTILESLKILNRNYWEKGTGHRAITVIVSSDTERAGKNGMSYLVRHYKNLLKHKAAFVMVDFSPDAGESENERFCAVIPHDRYNVIGTVLEKMIKAFENTVRLGGEFFAVRRYKRPSRDADIVSGVLEPSCYLCPPSRISRDGIRPALRLQDMVSMVDALSNAILCADGIDIVPKEPDDEMCMRNKVIWHKDAEGFINGIRERKDRRRPDIMGERGLVNDCVYKHPDGSLLFVTDYHRKVLWLWWRAFSEGILNMGAKLFHLDAHRDDTKEYIPGDAVLQKRLKNKDASDDEVLEAVIRYSRDGSYVMSAMESGILDRSGYRFANFILPDVSADLPEDEAAFIRQFVGCDAANIDMDVLCRYIKKGDDYIVTKLIPLIAQAVSGCKVITIATSPMYFQDEGLSIRYARNLARAIIDIKNTGLAKMSNKARSGAMNGQEESGEYMGLTSMIQSMHLYLTDNLIKKHSLRSGCRILLSEKLFEEEDAGNIRRLLGDDSIVKVRPSEEIRRILARDGDASPATVGCVLSRQEFENQQLWNGEVGNKASVLVLEEEMKGQRYAYLEGIVTFVMAMMKEDREAMDWYMSRIFECKEERGPSYEELAGFLIRDRDPIKFLRHVRFSKIKTVSEGELPNRYKMMVENCLVMA